MHRIFDWLLGYDKLKLELQLAEARMDKLEPMLAELQRRVAKLEAAQKMSAIPSGLRSQPRYTPDMLPPEVAKLVDWQALGIDDGSET